MAAFSYIEHLEHQYVYRTRAVDSPTNQIASRVCKVLAQVFRGCAEFLARSKNKCEPALHPEIWDRKHETARKVRNLRVGKSFGQGQK